MRSINLHFTYLLTYLCAGYNYDSISIRRTFDCLSKVIKVTVTSPANRSNADLRVYLLAPSAAVHEGKKEDVEGSSRGGSAVECESNGAYEWKSNLSCSGRLNETSIISYIRLLIITMTERIMYSEKHAEYIKQTKKTNNN